ncbi:MAG: NUDIX hydrolase [Chloroflexi bacterium]|nr:NUDIX hydrolase [Chloroflexota bacterium]
MDKEQAISSQSIYQGRVLSLRVDTVRLPSGGTTRREVVEHAPVAAIVPVDAQGRVLLVRQFRYAVGESLLEIPAGGVDPGETPEACARRELAEETGFAPGRLELLGQMYATPGISNEDFFIYLATGLEPSAPHAPDEDEAIALERVPLADIPALLAAGAFRDAKTVAGLLLVLRRMG